MSSDETEIINGDQFYDAEDIADISGTGLEIKNLNICRDLKNKIFDDIHAHKKNKIYLVQGEVQSGKSSFIIKLSHYMLLMNYSVIIILRNSNQDRQQLKTNFNCYFEEQVRIENISKKVKVVNGSAIYLALANFNCLTHAINIKNKRYILIIDEIDSYLHDTITNQKLQELKDGAKSIIGITATMMDPMYRENCHYRNFFKMVNPENYVGFEEIRFRAIPESSFGNKEDVLNDKDLESFIEEIYSKKPFKNHPHICLITNCAENDPYRVFQEYICSKYKKIDILRYNKDGVFYQRNIKKAKFETIGSALEFLRTDSRKTHRHIFIFAGKMADRGISFVSRSEILEDDRKWHLTSQRLLVTDTMSEPAILQKLRLLGRYNDNIIPTLYTTKRIYKDLKKAYYRLNEYLDFKAYKYTNTALQEIPMYKAKFSKRCPFYANKELNINKLNVTNYVQEDDNLELYDEKYDFNEEKHELKQIKRLFGKWANEDNKSKISLFMKHINPTTYYSIQEFEELCACFKISKNHLQTFKYESGSRGYGRLFLQDRDGYFLDPDLVQMYKDIF